MNKSAFARLAMLARSISGMNSSVFRVYITRTSGQFVSISLPNFNAIFKATSFSLESEPKHPVSCPP